MKRLIWLIVPFALMAGPAQAAPVTITPPDTLVLDGVSIDQGIFTLVSATTIDIAQSIATGSLVSTSLIPDPVVIDPAIIGSGTEHVLFNAPDTFLPLNIFDFTFEVVDPVLPNSVFNIVGGVTFSAVPNFDISLPTTTGDLTTGPAIGFEYIDVNGQSIFANNLFDRVGFAPDPNAAVNFDIFGNGSLYFVFLQPLDTPFSFQDHGGISGFTPQPAVVPLPGAIWLMGSVLALVTVGRKRYLQS